MDRYYFIEVQAYKSVNNMGLELGQYVENKYAQTVVNIESMGDIALDIKDKIEELHLKYPRCKELIFEHRLISNGNGENVERITARPNTPRSLLSEGYVFILTTKCVRKGDFKLDVLY